MTDTKVIVKPTIPTHISFSKFDKKKIFAEQPEKKEATPKDNADGSKGQKITYHIIVLMYDYGLDKPSVTEFKVELCKLKSSFGIQKKPSPDGKGTDYSIMVKFNPAVDEQKAVIDFFNNLYQACAEIIFPVKGKVKLPSFDVKNPEASLKHPIYRPRDDASGELIEGRQPSMFFKLFSRGKAPNVIQTLFTQPVKEVKGGVETGKIIGKPINWDLLIGSEIEFIPLILIKRMYFGTSNTIQMEMVSAVVTAMKLPNTESNQNDTLQSVVTENPMVLDDVLSQIATISAARQGTEGIPAQLVSSGNQSGHSGHSGANEPTNAGIGGSSEKPSMASFTGGAPMRPQFGALKLGADDDAKFN